MAFVSPASKVHEKHKFLPQHSTFLPSPLHNNASNLSNLVSVATSSVRCGYRAPAFPKFSEILNAKCGLMAAGNFRGIQDRRVLISTLISGDVGCFGQASGMGTGGRMVKRTFLCGRKGMPFMGTMFYRWRKEYCAGWEIWRKLAQVQWTDNIFCSSCLSSHTILRYKPYWVHLLFNESFNIDK